MDWRCCELERPRKLRDLEMVCGQVLRRISEYLAHFVILMKIHFRSLCSANPKQAAR